MRKALSLALLVALSLGLALLVLEWGYRTQLLDTYRPELHAFNPAQVLEQDGKPTLLVMGDSFTAGRTSYAGILQDTVREWRVLNAAVSGTGVRQALYMAPRRFSEFRPAIFLYQVYVGNDLFDLRYPMNWRSISPGRNVYWFLANHLHVVNHLNYRLGQLTGAFTSGPRLTPPLGAAMPAAPTADPGTAFAAERYSTRVRIYLRAEPSLLEDSILVQGSRGQDYGVFLEEVARLLAYCPQEACRAYILVIPHVSQVDEAYVAHMGQLGARFTSPAAMRLAEYPFLVGLRARFASWSHVHVVNPLPMLRERHRLQAVYYPNDDHLNPDGQLALAAWLARELRLR